MLRLTTDSETTAAWDGTILDTSLVTLPVLVLAGLVRSARNHVDPVLGTCYLWTLRST